VMGTMRRNEKEITDRGELDAIIRQAHVCRVALVDGDRPYLVPMNFGYLGDRIYFHCAAAGKKMEILRRNNNVCFSFDIDLELRPGKEACQWGMRYRSVIGFGTAVLVEDMEEKRIGLAAIMHQYAEGEFSFPEEAVRGTVIIRVDIESMTGKKSGY
jgi:uncharacterized protein